MLPRPVRRLWDLLGVASDLQGRVTIVALTVGGIGVLTGATVGQSVLIAVGLLAIGLAIVLLMSGHWHQERRMKEADEARAAAWRPPVEPRALGRYLEEINETMEAHGFGRNPNLVAERAGIGWSINMAVATPPKIGRAALSISVYSERGTAPEELQCVVVGPEGTEWVGRDRAELFRQAEPSTRLYVLFPYDFAGGPGIDWPPPAGTYRVVAQAIRASARGMIPENVAETDFAVDAKGSVRLSAESGVA